jgi:hypothetical protein
MQHRLPRHQSCVWKPCEASRLGGQQFGNTGAYEHLTARAYGEIDPADPHNTIIQDLGFAPRNARGMVEYVTSVEILKPTDMARGNRVLFS